MSGYYSIDAILTDAQKVPCTFMLDVPGLGYLDDNAGGDVCPLPLLPSPFPLPPSHLPLPSSPSPHIPPSPASIHPTTSSVLTPTTPQQIKAHHTPPIPLPLWLAELLALQRFPAPSTSTSNSYSQTVPAALITLDLPECLSPRVMNALKADAKSVRLRELGGYWYSVLCRVLELFEEDELVGVGGEVSFVLVF